ncbi:MAG: universal stress protein [Magnetococcales bacterium]|nr:universal stress protein [Magnetococcales bacterium]
MNDTDPSQDSQFKHILMATDGSEFGLGVERVCMEMALQHQSHLYVLRLLLSDASHDMLATEEQEATQHIQKIASQCSDKGISCTMLVRSAQDPAQGILATATEIDANLIAVGRRGKRGLARFMVGEATTRIIEKSSCSVLVVPRLVTIWHSGTLLVVDPDQADNNVAQAAYDMASRANLPLTILVVDDDHKDDATIRETNQLVNRLVATAKIQGIAAEGLIQTGKIDDVILEIARQRSVDLIVCGPRDRSMIDKLFNNNNIIHLVGQVHCPVIIVR